MNLRALRIVIALATCVLAACNVNNGGVVPCFRSAAADVALQQRDLRGTLSLRDELTSGYVRSLCPTASARGFVCHAFALTHVGLAAFGYNTEHNTMSSTRSALSCAPPPAQPSGVPQPQPSGVPQPSPSGSGGVPSPAPPVGPCNVAQPLPGLPSGYGPQDFQSAYNLTCASASLGTGKTVVLVEIGNAPDIDSDLSVYRSTYGLPPCTTANGCFKVIGDSQGIAPSDDGGEETLDVEMVSAICPLCKIVMVAGNDLADATKTAAALHPAAISLSVGITTEVTDMESAFDQPGIPIAIADGDSGTGGSDIASPQDYASASVIAVGGTALKQSGSGWSETAWSSGGSGCSAIIAKPSWQTDTGCSKRTMSDVAFDGDPGTGAAVYQKSQGGWQVVGGTSMSAPAIAAIYALGGGTGVQSLYKAMGTSAIKDIVGGSNGSCSPAYICHAGPGFDGPTGVGVPNGITAFGP